MKNSNFSKRLEAASIWFLQNLGLIKPYWFKCILYVSYLLYEEENKRDISLALYISVWSIEELHYLNSEKQNTDHWFCVFVCFMQKKRFLITWFILFNFNR